MTLYTKRPSLKDICLIMLYCWYAMFSSLNVTRKQGKNLMKQKMAVFWAVAPYSLVDTDRRFGWPYCLHHQGDEAVSSYPARCVEIYRYKCLKYFYANVAVYVIFYLKNIFRHCSQFATSWSPRLPPLQRNGLLVYRESHYGSGRQIARECLSPCSTEWFTYCVSQTQCTARHGVGGGVLMGKVSY
jgi:hypothetical protein